MTVNYKIFFLKKKREMKNGLHPSTVATEEAGKPPKQPVSINIASKVKEQQAIFWRLLEHSLS
jgi:hypothetical protein